MVALIAAPVSNPWAIPYSSDAKTLRVTRLHLIDDQWTILALLFLSVSAITKPIWDERSQLLAKDESVKIINLRESLLVSSCTKRSPLEGLSICHCSRLLSCFACSSFGLTTCAANERSKAASGWQTVAMQAPLALWAMYWSFGVAALRTSPLELVRSMAFMVTNFRFWH